MRLEHWSVQLQDVCDRSSLRPVSAGFPKPGGGQPIRLLSTYVRMQTDLVNIKLATFFTMPWFSISLCQRSVRNSGWGKVRKVVTSVTSGGGGGGGGCRKS